MNNTFENGKKQLGVKCIIIQNDQSNKNTTLCVQFIIQSRILIHLNTTVNGDEHIIQCK